MKNAKGIKIPTINSVVHSLPARRAAMNASVHQNSRINTNNTPAKVAARKAVSKNKQRVSMATVEAARKVVGGLKGAKAKAKLQKAGLMPKLKTRKKGCK